MTKAYFRPAMMALTALTVAGVATVPDAAIAQNYHHHRRHHANSGDDRYYGSNTDRGHYDNRHCGSGNGAVGTVAGGAGGAVLGNVLGGGTLGTVAGGVGGALLGRTLDKNNTRNRNMRQNGC
jgi:outer membrane lipoprotein SlyB